MWQVEIQQDVPHPHPGNDAAEAKPDLRMNTHPRPLPHRNGAEESALRRRELPIAYQSGADDEPEDSGTMCVRRRGSDFGRSLVVVLALLAPPPSASVTGVQAFALFAPNPIAAAQLPPLTSTGDRPAARAVRTGGSIVVDGVPDEEVWLDAEPLVAFTQQEPREGGVPSQRTEVRILFNDDALYVAAWLFDTNPQEIIPGERVRDAELGEGDAFILVLDTFRDRQNAFLFGTNPLGVEVDGHITRDGHPGGPGRGQSGRSGGGLNLDWDANWTVATSRDEAGWYVEMRIPFTSLRYAGGEEQVWGLNAARFIRRNNERVFWAPVSRQYDINRVSLAGSLEGVSPPTSRTMSVTPYMLQLARRDFRTSSSYDTPFDFGADAKLGVTPALTLDLTWNTDFAQAEVDDERIDLTRFNVFFPEKRAFFLENAGLFSIGAPGFLQLFHSRRIGIGPGGQEVPMKGGGRLTGDVASFRVGGIYLETEGRAEVEPATRFGVARLERQILGDSRIGGIYTGRVAPGVDESENHLAALDGRLMLGPNSFVEGYLASTRTPGLEGRRHSYYLNADYEGARWLGRVSVMAAGEDFDPGMGFLRRTAFQAYTAQIQRRIRFPEIGSLRELRPHVQYLGYYDFSGLLETNTLRFQSRMDFENGGFVHPIVVHNIETLTSPFRIAPDVVIPVERYHFINGTIRFGTNASAPIALRGALEAGEFYSGTRTGGNAALALRSTEAVMAEVSVAYNYVDLAEGSFETRLAGLRLAYAPTPSLFVRSLVQYSSQAEIWSANFRLGWLKTAGTGVFMVYSGSNGIDNWDGAIQRRFAIKATHRFELGR